MDDVIAKLRRRAPDSGRRMSRLATLSLIALSVHRLPPWVRASVRRLRVRFQISNDVGHRILRLIPLVVMGALLAIIGAISWVLIISMDQASEIGEETEQAAIVAEVGAALHQELAVADQLLTNEMLLESLADAPSGSSTTGDAIRAATEGEPPPTSHPNLTDHGLGPAAALFRTKMSQLEGLVTKETSQLAKVFAAHDVFVESVDELHDIVHDDGLANRMDFYHTRVQFLGAEAHAAILELRRAQNEEIVEAVEAMGALEGLFRTVVPALLVLAFVLAYAAYRLRTAWRRQQIRELEKINQTKSEFIATVSHELRTPLTSVVGFAELLRIGDLELSPAERAEMLETICHQGFEVAGIVEDLLVTSRAELGELMVVSVSVDLQAQVAQVLEHLRSERAVRVETQKPGLKALGDPLRVRQILNNLLRNADLHGGDDISIEFDANSPSSVSVSVIDDGGGIPAESQAQMFQPFERAQDSSAPLGSIGLGLTVSRQLAQLMRGELNYRYQDGKSIFTLSLPAAPSSSHLTPQAVSQTFPA